MQSMSAFLIKAGVVVLKPWQRQKLGVDLLGIMRLTLDPVLLKKQHKFPHQVYGAFDLYCDIRDIAEGEKNPLLEDALKQRGINAQNALRELFPNGCSAK